MKPNAKKSIVYAKVLDWKVVMVEIAIHPASSHINTSLKENKTNSYQWFTAEYFHSLTLKLQDVILARVLAPSETTGKKKIKGDKTLPCSHSEMLHDHELLIQYQFVKRRKCKQIVLVRKKQASLAEDPRKDLKQCDYSGGGHESYEFFPEKLDVTVSLNSELVHQTPLVTPDVQEQRPSTSTISKYFNKETATETVTRSTQKKRAALKNLNKKYVSQQKIESHLCSASDVGDKLEIKEEKNNTATDSTELQTDAQRKHDQISWVNKLGKEVEIQDVVSFHDGESVQDIKDEEREDKNVRRRQGNAESEQRSSENCNSACGVSVNHEDKLQATSSNEYIKSLKDMKGSETVCNNKGSDSKLTSSPSSKLKRRRSFSESDAADTDSVPSLRSRISNRNAIKKQKSVSSDESGGNRKQIASVSDKTVDDNDFETPKVRRNAAKRKGSDLSDDVELYSSVFSTKSETSSSAKPKAKEGVDAKKRKTKKVETKRDALDRKATNQARKRITRRQTRTANKTTVRNLEDVSEEPGSSPAEPITVEEDKPVTLNISTIEELTASDTEKLVWEYARELREIFEGKKYCRRHEDYKKGGKMKGDLAFQVQFGSFSEEQRDRIMGVLTNMFCYKHSKYFDYVSKVLLPETLVMLYMRVVGKTRNEAERLLLEGPTLAD